MGAAHLIPYLMGNSKRDGGRSRGTFTGADRWLTCDRWKMMYIKTIMQKASMELLPCDAPESKTAAKESSPKEAAEGEVSPAICSVAAHCGAGW